MLSQDWTSVWTYSRISLSFHTGNFSCAIIHFEFSRQLQSYVLTVYVPSVLLVIIAWLSFWIDAEAAPARVSVGVTTVLTVTTMTSGIQETLPIVTYAKVGFFFITVVDDLKHSETYTDNIKQLLNFCLTQ